MNNHSHLRLQAYLDGELSNRESQEVEKRLQDDPESQQLLAELGFIKSALAGNEPERKLPESRDFFWSKIQREIERVNHQPVAVSRAGGLGWRKFFAPLAAVGLVAMGLTVARFYTPEDTSTWSVVEVEDLAEEASSFSFRSASENMFVVWLHQRNDDFVEPSTFEMIPQ
jgi:anti-sigma factor RsiW